MRNAAHAFSMTILLLVATAAAPAQEKPQGPPPAQGPDDVRAFPVLYLLHGIGGDETEWICFATCWTISFPR